MAILLAPWAVCLAMLSQIYAADLVNLMVEYQTKPLAIDTVNPRFSWQLGSAERAVMQKAYRILVSDTAQGLNDPTRILWDTGLTKSDRSFGVIYDGQPLKSRTRYFWKVQVLLEEGGKPIESLNASFRTGVLSEHEWVGRWIWEDKNTKPNDYAYFRTVVDLKRQASDAVAIISAHDFCALWINGKRVSGYVNPAPSNPFKSKYYLAYDITSFLKEGPNAIAIAAHYRGMNGRNYVKGVPGAFFEAKIDLMDGSSFILGSGPSWKVLPQTPYDEKAPFFSDLWHTAAERFDARKEPPEWKQEHFDDTSWPLAVVIDPKYRLKSQYLPECAEDRLIAPVKIAWLWPGAYLLDFGREISGWLRLRVEGIPGEKICLRYSDRLFLGRFVTWSLANYPTASNYDTYTLAGRGLETWEPQFGFRGFRYVQVSGFPAASRIEDVKAVFAHVALQPTASFSCSNELVNKIYDISVHTQTMGMLGQLVDCVHREQSQWLADADMQSGNVFYTFFDPHIVRKALVDFKDGQYSSGRFPANYPSMSPNQFRIPEWDLHYVPMLWRTYLFYGDVHILEECWPAVEKMLSHFEGRRDKTGLVRKDEEWHISDWPEDYARFDHSGMYLTAENCLYYDTLRAAVRIADTLNLREKAEKGSRELEGLKKAINTMLYDRAAKAYIDCSGSNRKHAGASVLALQFGIVPEEDIPEVLSHVKRQGMGTSVCLTYNLLETLYMYDEGQFAFHLINNEEWPGWGYMLKKGDGTTWESWYNFSSRSHPFNAYLQRFLVSGVVGIRPIGPGWKRMEIRPHTDGLKWGRAGLKTIIGEVSASWRQTEKGFSLRAVLPPNSMARVSIPLPDASKAVKIFEGGRLLWPPVDGKPQEPDPQYLNRDEKYVNFLVGSGEWHFECSADAP